MHFREILHPDCHEKLTGIVRARLRGEDAPSRYELKYLTKSEETGWSDLTAGVIQYGGRPAIIGLLVDITEKKKTEADLHAAYEQLAASEEELREQYEALQESLNKIQESERNYRSIIENLPGAFYRADQEGNLTLLSPSFAEQFGYSSTEELIGKKITDFYVNPSDRHGFLKKLEKTGKVKSVQVTLKRQDKTPILVSISGHHISDEFGNPVGVEGIIQEVLGAAGCETVIHKRKEPAPGSTDDPPDLVMILDNELNLTYLSPPAGSAFRYDPAYLIGMPLDYAYLTIFSQTFPELADVIRRTAGGGCNETSRLLIQNRNSPPQCLFLQVMALVHGGFVLVHRFETMRTERAF
jgi:PAS domain S-box-containing protein